MAPFALAARMRLLDGWRDLARPAGAFGVLTVVALAATGASQSTAAQGWTQRVAAVLVPLGVVALALRVRRLAVSPAAAAPSGPGRGQAARLG
ncbi:MAG TPA: hypothetical protein VFD04_02045 [Actinomycetes bacterium]|nr:hypothetical protein [Actinomycetes bacterium]